MCRPSKKQSLVSVAAAKCSRRVRVHKEKKLHRLVKEYYLRQDISRPLPHGRYSTKHGPAHVMVLTMIMAWKQFRQEFPGEKVGYTLFTQLRPKNVRLLDSVPAETCLCIHCLNIKYKLEAVNHTLAARGLPLLPPENKLLKLICCPVSGEPDTDCVFGDCSKCSDSLRNIKPLTEAVITQSVRWSHWSRTGSSGVNKLDVTSHQGTVEDLLKSLQRDIDNMSSAATFREHIFNPHWQLKVCQDLKFTTTYGEVLMIMGFAENRKACYGEEVKSAHFGKSQITLHPIVAYWKNTRGQLLRHILMYLSDDIRHDYHAVQHFTAHAVECVKQQVSLRRVIIFSDGCASQYKGKGTFADLSLTSGVELERVYYGSEHGKGEADGETGVLSRQLKRAVQGGQVNIRHAADLFAWATANMTLTSDFSARRFFLVDTIQRDRPETEVSTIHGTRKFHQVQRVGDYKIRCRRLACFCSGCRKDNPNLCVNRKAVGMWKICSLKRNLPAANAETDLNEGFLEEVSDNLNEGFIEEVSDNERPVDMNEAFVEDLNETLEPSDPSNQGVKSSNHEDVYPIGSFVEVTHRTERGTLKVYRCMVVTLEGEMHKSGDLGVYYLKKTGPHYSLDHPKLFIINKTDINVVDIVPLKTPALTARGHYIF